ncbi:hypothetical protein GQ44DRAFT_775905 [Phaeosphaeriaceae sp. PMI808]|nr:hypothetical protein GQ44DRAFT_775905 [Phaeosphaeriaceae sp. PMI808]
MKFLVTLLALSAAVLAAPTEVAAREGNPPFFVQDSMACACTNAKGEAIPSASISFATCPYGNELANIGELSNFCFITSPYARPLEQVFSSQYCARFPGYPNVTCKPVKLCLAFPQCTNFPNDFSLCGHPQEVLDLYCQRG